MFAAGRQPLSIACRRVRCFTVLLEWIDREEVVLRDFPRFSSPHVSDDVGVAFFGTARLFNEHRVSIQRPDRLLDRPAFLICKCRGSGGNQGNCREKHFRHYNLSISNFVRGVNQSPAASPATNTDTNGAIRNRTLAIVASIMLVRVALQPRKWGTSVNAV